MGLPPPDSQLYRHVPYVSLHKLRERLHFLQLRRLRSRQFRHLLLDFRRSFSPSLSQPVLPPCHVAPVLKSLVLTSSRWKQGHDHLARYTFPRRHVGFRSDSLHIFHNPLPLIASRRRRFRFGIIQPHRLVFPARRKLQRVVRLPNGSSRFLKRPDILHDVRAHFLFDLITNYVAWIRRGNGQHFRLEVRHELAVLHAKQRRLHGILVFHFVVFALRWDAPAMHAVDLR